MRVGAAIRAVRLRRGLRQSDVATLAGVSQSTVSLVERGHLESLTVASVRTVARALDIRLPFEAWWRGAELPRLLDERHASLVGAVVARLRHLGWEVRVEHSFNVRGERGSVDVVGWLGSQAALLIIEVKSQLVDVQELLSTFDRKRRVVPAAVAADFGWRPFVVGQVLVLPEETVVRTAVARHADVFAASLPARTVDVRRWCREPSQPLAGIWFLRDSNTSNRMRAGGGPRRVRRRASGEFRVGPRSRVAS
ncbi:MAG: helix-turn-helix domain-containing protein [Candidatus Limnocylindrales bacterium]|jgi:transcriptional regulator with XRE-family HTH domain